MARRWSRSQRVLAYDPLAVLPVGVERVANLQEVGEMDGLDIVLAVKPQAFDNLAQDLVPLGALAPLFVSVMAGITIDRMQGALGDQSRVVRTMPSIGSAVGAGITAAVAGRGVSDDERVRVSQMLDQIGAHLWLEVEQDLDLVTAISGSGPAYFYRMTEVLSNAGVRAGLAPDVAAKLARSAFTGAAMVAVNDRRPIADLREQVTSPGGTTAAGLQRLDDKGAFEMLIDRAVMSATTRARELAR